MTVTSHRETGVQFKGISMNKQFKMHGAHGRRSYRNYRNSGKVTCVCWSGDDAMIALS